MIRLKRWMLLLMAVLAAASLTGCFSLDYHLTFHDSNEVTVDTTGILERGAASLLAGTGTNPVEEMSRGFASGRFRVSPIDDTRGVGLTAERTFDLRQPGVDPLAPLIGQSPHVFRVDPGLFSSTVTIEGSLDTSNGAAELAQLGPGVSQDLANSVDLRFGLTLPRPPISSNATMVEDSGRTLIWQLQPGATNPIEVQFTLLRWKVIAAAAVALLLIMIMAVVFLNWATASKSGAASG